mgnify:CR=1 FL=1
MPAANVKVTICTFENDEKIIPEHFNTTWAKLVERLSVHKELPFKEASRLFSPVTYAPNATRSSKGVQTINLAVGDFDHGQAWEDIKDILQVYEYAAYSTYSFSPDDCRFRVVIPFTTPVPNADWPKAKAKIDYHVFRQGVDKATKDSSRLYYLPSCAPGAPRFAVHHEGKLLDPTVLPDVPFPKNGASEPGGNGEATGTMKMQLGKNALDFVANGAPIGEQRDRALAAARNYLSAGYSVEDTIKAVWRGLERCPEEDRKGPWTVNDAEFIVNDLNEKEAPPLPIADRSVSPRMEIIRQNLGYFCSFPSAGVTVKVDRVKRTSEGIKAEIDIQCSIPGIPKNMPWGSLNFASITARKGLVKILNERSAPIVLDWDGMLQDVCRKVTIADRAGEPFIRFDELKPRERATWLVRMLLPRGHITTIFGEGGSGKSNFGLANGLSVGTGKQFVPGYMPMAVGTVLYLDYETDESEMKARERALCTGLGYKGPTNMIYRHCQRSLPDDIEETIHECQENNVALVIVDSVAMATAGLGESGNDQNESVIKLYAALRLLNTTCLLIDHVSAADLEKKGPRKPYGSIYKMNLARMAFDLRSTSKSGISPLHIAIHNLKRNDGPLLPSVGLCVIFGSIDGIDYSEYSAETISDSELQKDLKGPDKIRFELSRGMKTAVELISLTGLSESNVYKILSREEQKFLMFNEDGRYGLVSMRHTYGL